MLVHKKLLGEDAGRYLPFALSKLRYFASVWDGTLVSRVIRTDDAEIIMELWSADEGSVTIIAGALAYEFFTSESEAGNPLNVAGSFTEARGKHPITSTTLAKGEQPPDWDVGAMPQDLRTFLSVNRQRHAEYSWFGKNQLVQSALGAHQAGNTFDGRRVFRGLFTSNELGQRIEVDAYFTYDVGFDVAPAIYGNGTTLPLAPLTPAPLWWRRAAVKKVGERSFVIATDAHSNFYAYPLKENGQGTQRLNGTFAVPAGRFQKIAAASLLPAGVSVPTVDSMRPAPSPVQYARDGVSGLILLQFTTINQAYQPPAINYSAFPGEEAGWDRSNLLQDNHYVWTFNSDCSRAAAVVNSDELPRSVSESSANPSTGAIETRTIPFKHLKNYSQSVRVPYWTESLKGAQISALGGLREVSAARRSVVEVDLAITVFGDGDMDFTFTATPRRILSGECFMDADYAFGDKRLENSGIAKDDLLVASLRRYMLKTDGTTWVAGVDADNGSTIQNRAFLVVSKAQGPIVKAWQLGVYSGQAVIDQKAADLAFGDYGVAHAPYGRYTDFHIDFTLAYKDVQIARQAARVSVLALDLRSLSAVLECETYASPDDYQLQDTVYGTNASLAGYFFGAKVVDDYPALTAHLDQALPSQGLMPYGYKGSAGTFALDENCIWMDLYRIDADFMMGEINNAYAIASHPDGHAAFAVVRSGSTNHQSLDTIQRRTGETVKTSTHLAAFNAAWGQSRGYANYAFGGAQYPGRLQGYAIWRDVLPKKVTGFSYD